MAQLVDRRSGAGAPPAEAVVAQAPEPNAGDVAGLTAEQLRGQAWRLVQNLADALPDDVTRFAREALADDRPDEALSAVLFACLQFGTTVSTVEFAVLDECLMSVGEEVSPLDHVTVGDTERPVVFEFMALPQSVHDLAMADAAASDDDEAVLAEGVRRIDEQVIARIGALDAALGIWRAWRYPVTGGPWPRAVPVYLVEAQDEDSAQDLITAIYGGGQGMSGSPDPIVEIYAAGSELPPLHRALQFAGELVFSAAAPPAFSFADVFEGEPDAEGRPQALTRISEDEAARLSEYLLSGTPMLVADTQGEDVLDRTRGQSVPLHLRTDGTWVWSDASVYYLREYLVAPPPAFHTYLQTVPATAERVSDATLHQAVTWLQTG